ncbi:MAG: 5'-methylthioadenosine/S-adenosylhomocysteine nucleosidase [Candidatus Heimdallarchaeota archaeon]|nr:5'-methylthioadenosine/S-adenosylhomocysteine nucleosidase [Candidatus Heimdallarchaeota archaeon]
MVDEILIAALPIETQNLTEKYIKTIYTGVGKVNAAIKTTQAIFEHKPKRIINYGTAGSHIYNQGQLIDCTQFVQRDIDVTGLGFRVHETPFDGDIPLKLDFKHSNNLIGKNATLYSGDSFVVDRTIKYEVVDMEGYAIAKACYFHDIDFISYKYISDGADENPEMIGRRIVRKVL